MTRNQWLLLTIIGAVIAAYVLGDGERLLDPSLYHEMFRQRPATTVLVFFTVFLLGTAFSLPVTGALSVVSGIIFGDLIGIPLALMASTIGGTIGFLFSRYMLHALVQQRFAVHLGVINRGVEKDGMFYLVSMRMIPVIPFWLLNLLMGLTPLTTARFFLATLVGMLPIIAILVHFGAQLGAVKSFTIEEIFTPGLLLSMALLATLPFLMKALVKVIERRRGQTTDGDKENTAE